MTQPAADWPSDEAIDESLRFEHLETEYAIRDATIRLKKLSVAELRVLFAHYFKFDGEDLRKPDLVCELAPALAGDYR